MLRRLFEFASIAVLGGATLVGCGGGGGATTPSGVAAQPLVPAPASSAISSYVLTTGTASYPVPPLAGFGGTLTFDTSTAPPSTQLQITSLLQMAAGSEPSSLVRAQQNSTLNFLFFNTINLSSTVTISQIKATYTLPNTIDPTAKQFFIAISDPTNSNAALSFQTSGPAAITGQSLTFPAFDTPITLQAGVKYVLSIYYTTGTLVPTPSPSPAPVFLGYVSDIASYGFDANCGIVNFSNYGCIPVTDTGATITGTLSIGAYFEVFGTVSPPNVTATSVIFASTPFPGSPTPPPVPATFVVN